MNRIVAPQKYIPSIYEERIFLAGGITDAPMWQDDLVNLLSDTDLIVFDPRRKEYNDSKEVMKEQIEWEYTKLRDANIISFWFPFPSKCVITMYELGFWAAMAKYYEYMDKKVFVGVDPKFWRKGDIEIQLGLLFPGFKIASSLVELSEQIKSYLKERT